MELELRHVEARTDIAEEQTIDMYNLSQMHDASLPLRHQFFPFFMLNLDEQATKPAALL